VSKLQLLIAVYLFNAVVSHFIYDFDYVLIFSWVIDHGVLLLSQNRFLKSCVKCILQLIFHVHLSYVLLCALSCFLHMMCYYYLLAMKDLRIDLVECRKFRTQSQLVTVCELFFCLWTFAFEFFFFAYHLTLTCHTVMYYIISLYVSASSILIRTIDLRAVTLTSSEIFWAQIKDLNHKTDFLQQ